MYSKITERGYIIRIERGEKVIEMLANFCKEKNIQGGSFTAIGAVSEAEVGYYDFEKRQYFSKKHKGDLEVVSMSGNVSIGDAGPIIHPHIVLSKGIEGTCIGGHLDEAIVSLTLEISLDVLKEPLERRHDTETGLKLLQL